MNQIHLCSFVFYAKCMNLFCIVNVYKFLHSVWGHGVRETVCFYLFFVFLLQTKHVTGLCTVCEAESDD